MNKTKEKLNKIEKNLIKISFSPSKYPPPNIIGCKSVIYAIFYYFVKISGYIQIIRAIYTFHRK
jgi:hypothetical protein